MGYIELVLIAFSLSADAFGVSVCKGLSVQKLKFSQAIVTGLWFGGFQALMPAIGYFVGSRFQSYIENFDHWIAFGLLVIIGVNMIREASETAEAQSASFGVRAMFPLAIATSIDALAAGVAFAMEDGFNVAVAVSLIGMITFILSALGVYVGKAFGARYKAAAERVGGIVLCALGLKILLEHLGVLPF
ncbi:MAG: manganese efflux pump [Clostridia bacterium]|nr:manganese efflux pump [Clostridia bacterium]